MAGLAGTTLGVEATVELEAVGAGREPENEWVKVGWMVCEALLPVGPFWTVVVLPAMGVGTTTTAVVWVHSSMLAWLRLALLLATDRADKGDEVDEVDEAVARLLDERTEKVAGSALDAALAATGAVVVMAAATYWALGTTKASPGRHISPLAEQE